MKIMSTSPLSYKAQPTETQNKNIAFGKIAPKADEIIYGKAVQDVIKTASQKVQDEIGKIINGIRENDNLILDVINTKNIPNGVYDGKEITKDIPILYNKKFLNGSQVFVIKDAKNTSKIALISTQKHVDGGEISELLEENLVDGLVDYSKTINPELRSKPNFFKTIQNKMDKFINGNNPNIFEGNYLG